MQEHLHEEAACHTSTLPGSSIKAMSAKSHIPDIHPDSVQPLRHIAAHQRFAQFYPRALIRPRAGSIISKDGIYIFQAYFMSCTLGRNRA
jgi:hypothetical protein